MFPAPIPSRCVAYRGLHMGSWFVLVDHGHERFVCWGPNANQVWMLQLAAQAARNRGWF